MSDGELTRPESNDCSRYWSSWRVLAVSSQVAAVLLLIWYAATALLWRVYFEPSDVALFQAKVGSALLSRVVVAAIVLLAGVALSRPSLWGRPRAHVIGSVVALLSMLLTVAGVVQAERRLHPSFAVENSAVTEFALPSPERVETEVRPQQVLTAHWYVAGTEAAVCGSSLMSFVSWAEPGTAHKAANAMFNYSRVGRRGIDDVEIECYANPGTGRVVVQLMLSRAR